MQGSFWSCPRESASAAGARSGRVERKKKIKATTHAARAKSVGIVAEIGSSVVVYSHQSRN